ncbi:hypothetical protein DL765_002775 [Monosporascus sp. GIB2]|nr:hypothetical protein DL765_002775 [Monosporascus sp. GIB2]
MDFSGCLNDESIGPAAEGCRGDFDFTIEFEKIFFALIPTAIFIASCPARIVYLLRRPAIVGGSFLRPLLVLSGTKSRKFQALFVSSFALTFVSALCAIAVSYLEHSRSPRPSILLNAYLFVTILLDIAQARTLWLASFNFDEITFSRLFTTAVAAKAALIILESQQKSRWVRWDASNHSPEETTGLFGLGSFVWLNRLFLTGYKKILTLDDLYPLDSNMASERLQFKLAIGAETFRHPGQKYGLARALMKALAVPLLLPVGPRIAMIAFQFCQPFLINSILDYLQQSSDDSSRNIGYGLMGATILVHIGIATSGAFYWYLQERPMYMARGALIGAIYKKTTEAIASAAGDSPALTLMSADVERIIRGYLNIHEFWANTIQVGLASWLLSRQIGASFVGPLIVVGCCVISTTVLMQFTGPRQKAWMEIIQKRVGLTANVIGQMKNLKISGLAAPVEESIQHMRIDELKTGSRFRMIQILTAVISTIPLALSPVFAFALAARTLDVTTIFTSMSYIILLANPLQVLFQLAPTLLAAVTCLGRIQKFLEQDSRVDFRQSALSLSRESTVGGDSDNGEGRATPPIMSISGGNFGWQSGEPTLKNINLNIPTSCLTIVVGPIASGKSTLCKVLLGEAPVAHGQVVMGSYCGKIGYCDQNAYLLNATIRENIVGFATFDQSRYNEVLDATMLQPDLAALPLGDNSKVGSNGITLSGGQRQRVCIARALYLDSNFLVFDGILSGLDADTEEHVFRNLFSTDGLLRRRNVTTVLCTHSIRHLPSADHIVALGSDGSLVEQGSFHDLMRNKKYVAGLKVEEPDWATSEDNVRSANAEFPAQPKFAAKPIASSYVEDKVRVIGDTTVYRHYFARINTVSIVISIASSLGYSFFNNFNTIWLKFWSEDVSSERPMHSNSFYLGLYALFQMSALACLLFMCLICFMTIVQMVGATLHKETLRTVISAPLRFFATTDAGIVTNLFSQDMTLIDGQLPGSLVNFTIYTFSCLGMAAVIATSSPFLAITYPFFAVIFYGIQKFYLRTSRQIRLLDLEAKSPLYTHFTDTTKGIATVRAFGWIQDSIGLNNRLLDNSQRPAYLMAMIQRWLGFNLQLVVAALAFVVITLATQLPSNTAFTGASLVTLLLFGENLLHIVQMYTMLETSIAAVSRLKSFGERVRSENLDGEDVVPPPEWPLRGAILINGVSASYGGKSSIILLLLRLLDPLPSCAHNITIDDTHLHKIDRATLRQRIIAVPQEPVFLPEGTSFQSNLDPFGISSEEECRAVLEAVNLWPFVDQHGGLSAGMSSDTLSQGQKQLFSLARAILRRRIRSREREAELGEKTVLGPGGGVLLLDEVSSSVDQETNSAMQASIREEFEGYTIVMVSHRLDMVMGFDTVVVMDEGRVVETGRPETLVETEGSRFRELSLVGSNKRRGLGGSISGEFHRC